MYGLIEKSQGFFSGKQLHRALKINIKVIGMRYACNSKKTPGHFLHQWPNLADISILYSSFMWTSGTHSLKHVPLVGSLIWLQLTFTTGHEKSLTTDGIKRLSRWWWLLSYSACHRWTHKDMNLVPRTHVKQLGLVALDCILSAGERETNGSLRLTGHPL